MRRVTCRSVEALLFDYADGAVGEPERSAVAVHLAICDSCRASAELVSGVRIAVREAPLAEAPKRRSVSIEVDRFAPTRRRLLRGGLAACAAAACAAAVAFGLHPGATARGGDPIAEAAIAGNDADRETDRGTGSADPALEIDEAGHAAFEVSPGTALRCDGAAIADVLSSDARGVRFALTSGRAVAEVGAVEAGFRFIVVTPTAEIEARGTVFSVEVTERGATKVRVASGSVELRARLGGTSVMVGAGEELGASDPAPRTAEVDDMIRDLAVALELGGAGERPRADSYDRLAPSGAELPAATPAEVSAASDELVAAITSARDRLSALRGGTSPAGLLELAQAYRRASLFDDAARTYERLVAEHPHSEIGVGGLVALAQLESLVLGRHGAARTHYAAYLEAAPRGPLAAVARRGLAQSEPD